MDSFLKKQVKLNRDDMNPLVTDVRKELPNPQEQWWARGENISPTPNYSYLDIYLTKPEAEPPNGTEGACLLHKKTIVLLS